MKRCRLSYFAVLLALCITGCGTVRDIPNCPKPSEIEADKAAHRLWPGARVALAAGRFNAPNTVELTRTDASPGVQNPAVGAGVGAGGGAVMGAAACLYTGPLVVLCLPFGAAVGAVSGGVVGAAVAAKNAEEANTKEGQEKAAKMANAQAAERRLATSVEPVDLNRLLLEDIARYARDSEVGNFPKLNDQGPKSLDDEPQYPGTQDFVFEILFRETAVVEEVLPANYSLRLLMQGRLIRVSDNSVVSVFTAAEMTEARSAAQWNAENGALVIQELKNALGRLAKQTVDQWIHPVVSSGHSPKTTVVIFSPNLGAAQLRTVDISIDGCKVGSLGTDSYVTVTTSAGKHLIRSEGYSVTGKKAAGVATREINLTPGKTRYFILYSHSSIEKMWYFSEIEEGHVKFQFPNYKESVW